MFEWLFSFGGMVFLCTSGLICVSVQLYDCCSDLGRRHKVARVEQSFCWQFALVLLRVMCSCILWRATRKVKNRDCGFYLTPHLPFYLSFGDSRCNCVLVPGKSCCKIIFLVCGFASYTASHFLNGKLSLCMFWLFHSLPLLPNTDIQRCCKLSSLTGLIWSLPC